MDPDPGGQKKCGSCGSGSGSGSPTLPERYKKKVVAVKEKDAQRTSCDLSLLHLHLLTTIQYFSSQNKLVIFYGSETANFFYFLLQKGRPCDLMV
jgi:hypothetical protein